MWELQIWHRWPSVEVWSAFHGDAIQTNSLSYTAFHTSWFPRLSTLLCSLLRTHLERLKYAFMWMYVQIEMISDMLNGLPYRLIFLFEIYLTMLYRMFNTSYCAGNKNKSGMRAKFCGHCLHISEISTGGYFDPRKGHKIYHFCSVL